MKLHEASPWHLLQDLESVVAANVKLHGASPWHLYFFMQGRGAFI